MNVISEHPELASKLSNQLLSWLKKVNAKYPKKD